MRWACVLLCVACCDASKPSGDAGEQRPSPPVVDREADCTVLLVHADQVAKLSSSSGSEARSKLREHARVLRDIPMRDGAIGKHRDAYVNALESAATKLDDEQTPLATALADAERAIAPAKATCGDVPLPPLE